MPDAGEEKRPEGIAAAGDNLAFVAFTLTHASCGDGVIEARLGEGLLLQWCVVCADVKTFAFPGT